MEDKIHKCSSVEHSKIDAIIFYQACNVFYCNKCQNNFHCKIFPNHPIKNLNKEKNDIFTNICNEHNHLRKFEYFCKTHNKLCCVKCIAKIKDENNGQHKDCDISSLKEIKIEKEKKFEDNYNKLKEISNNLENTFNQFKVLIEQINKNKEELILEIQKVFTKIRTALNEREDELLSKVKEIYESSFFDEEIVKESEKLPIKVKQSLESIKDIKEIKDKENEISSEINYYIEFENNLNKINEMNKSIIKCNSNKSKIIFDYNKNELENIIKKFGKIEKKDMELVYNNLAEQTFQELEFYGFDLGKEQMISLIKENNFNKENVQNYINERISEQIYDNLSKSDDVDFKNNSKEDVLNKIKELNFNVDGIKEVYKKGKLVDPIVNPANEGGNEGGNGDDEEVDKLYQELEDEYGISGFIEEEAAKAKIRELNCNRDQIVDWIENNLLNGDN